jgi:hypothetical protein
MSVSLTPHSNDGNAHYDMGKAIGAKPIDLFMLNDTDRNASAAFTRTAERWYIPVGKSCDDFVVPLVYGSYAQMIDKLWRERYNIYERLD